MVNINRSGEIIALKTAIILTSRKPISVFEHPRFKDMIEMASCAKEGVKLPGVRPTRKEIIDMFQCHLRQLKSRFTMSPQLQVIYSTNSTYVQGSSVKGLISMTCDAWQASNTDGYFAVTGHWIEEINGIVRAT
jgi:hypothetical protein